MSRHVGMVGTSAFLAICLCGSAIHADEKDTYQSAERIAEAKKKEQADSGGGWFVWWFTDDAQIRADKKAAAAAKKTDTKKPNPPARNPLVTGEPLNEAVGLLSKEQAKFLRRQQACDRLREIAEEKNDPELERQAELLEQRAWWIYEQRTAKAKMTILLPPMGEKEAKQKLAEGDPATQRRNLDRPVRNVRAGTSGAQPGEEE